MKYKNIAILILTVYLTTCATDAAVFNVKTYGALGNGNADDTTAIQNALNAAAGNGVLYFPAGIYNVTQTLQTSAGSVTIQGEGNNLSTVRLVASDTTLFDLRAPTRTDTISMIDITLDCTGSNNTAVFVKNNNESIEPPRPSQHLAHTFLATRLHIIATSGTWGIGVELDNAWNSKFTNCYFANIEGPQNGDAVLFSQRSINCNFTDCSFSYWNRGIAFSENAAESQEGIIITGCVFTPVTYGVYYNAPTANADLRPLYIGITNTHIDARGDFCACIYLNAAKDVQIENCNLQVTANNNGQLGYCILLNGEQSLVKGNRITATAFPGFSWGGNGGVVLLGESNHNTLDALDCIVEGNIFFGFSGNTVWLQQDVNRNRVINNLFTGSTGTNVLDQGTNSVIYGN